MTPDIPDPNDRITPWILKWIVLPILGGGLLLMFLEVQVNQWKCSREAKRQGYLEGVYSPRFRFSPAVCTLEKQIKPDGTTDKSARKVIDLTNNTLNW
jgi:hypothetical protein